MRTESKINVTALFLGLNSETCVLPLKMQHFSILGNGLRKHVRVTCTCIVDFFFMVSVTFTHSDIKKQFKWVGKLEKGKRLTQRTKPMRLKLLECCLIAMGSKFRRLSVT